MRCSQCKEREAVFHGTMIGAQLGDFCRECAIALYVELGRNLGIPLGDLRGLSPEGAAEGLLMMGQRIVAAMQQQPPTTDHREIARRLAEHNSSSGPSAV